MTDVHIRKATPTPRSKPAPKTTKIAVPFTYSPSDDGTDENLLIILHGLGDTHVPFSRMAKNLKLPQTATLTLRAPELIPFLYEDAYQWYPSFDGLGQPIERPNPTKALDLLSNVLEHLQTECNWSPRKIHLFGFGQGGTVAVELCIRWWKAQMTSQNPLPLASIVSISGPLLSYPTLSTKCPTPLLIVQRPSSEDFAISSSAITDLNKGYQTVIEQKLSNPNGGMPASKAEWEPIMRFWSEKLNRRQADGLYEVMSGIATPNSK
ncbi:hypothetical protein BDN72DRAFT_831971 [Pluteus cervinus]|uniref:Uncharacterized protein n=1 Tax=Pluteus cervinus TaxID=181527 RepID=A0ACD3BDI5_9AGAR|nr:hypothetical protein BDN72DRAFT_831971 [Pluteus cervinus]